MAIMKRNKLGLQMKKAFLFALFVLASFSHAQLGDFFKSVGKLLEQKGCPDDVRRECGNTYGYFTLWCLEEEHLESNKGFRECSDFVEKCECLADTRLSNPQGNLESERDFRERAQKIQEIKNALPAAEQKRNQVQKIIRNCPDDIKRECSNAFKPRFGRSACDPGYNSQHIKTEAGFRYCSDLVKKCECWGLEARYDFQDIKEALLRQAKQDSVKKEAEKRKQATQDSIRNEIREEIFVLIENNAEMNLILGKCNEYNRRFTPLQECKDIQDSIKITKITALLKTNKLEESLEECSNINSNEKIADLCEKQLVAKIRKLPKNKITSPKLANIYYDCEKEDNNCKVMGYVINNDGKMILVSTLPFEQTAMVQISGNIINKQECMLRENRHLLFVGYAKYLGEKTYITVLGAQKSVPNYQLLWCGWDPSPIFH